MTDAAPLDWGRPDDVSTAFVEGRLLPADTLRRVVPDDLLDARDRDAAFERAYQQSWDAVQARKTFPVWNDETVQAETEVCRGAFFRVLEVTRHPEPAAYVSDDIGLLVSAAMLGYDDPFLANMRTVYEDGGVLGP